MYKPRYFKAQELVPPDVFEVRGDKSWELIDERLLMTLDQLRRQYGPMTANNWHIGGDRKWSGLRTADSPYYSQFSQHSFGRAADIIFSDVSTDKVRNSVLANPVNYPLITAVELDTSWLHIDVRNCEQIKTFKP